MNKSKRIVITGLGTLNAIANNIPQFVHALQEGFCGIKAIDLFDTTGFRSKNGGQIKNFTARNYIPSDFSVKRMSRADMLSFAATLEALRDADLYPLPDLIKEKMGVAIGGGSGGLWEAENFYDEILKKGVRKAKFSKLSSVYCASSADRIASNLGLMGPKSTFMTACSAGATAIGYARDLIVNDHASVMIAGGVEPMCRITYAAFNALKSVDPEVCRPFDKNRNGLSLGEAAAIMVLEPLDNALNRRAKIYGEILGYGVTCDSFHMTAPDEQASGAVRSMRAALKDSGLSIDNIDYINAHGTATAVNDVMETKAIKEVFGKRAYSIPVSSTKSMHAHTLGAAGALEGIVCVLSLQNGFIPPTINYRDEDPLCDLDYVTDGVRYTPFRTALSNSFAFGGNNTTIIFGKYAEGVSTMNKNRRTHKATKVVITGLGMVTPLGIGKEEFGRKLFAGECAIDKIKSFDTSSFTSHLGAEVTAFVPRDFISVKNLRRMDRTSIMSTAAARLTLDDAGIHITEGNRDRVGIILGTSFGATDVTVQFAGTLLAEGPAFVNPILVPNTVMNAPAGHASIELGFRGVNTTVTHFAVSAETALAYAVEEIRRGTADFVLAGGVDILSKFYYEALIKFRSLSPLDENKEACRPFDEARNGIVVGEGCGMVCLESWESAVTRGRQPYCEIKGFGLGSSPTSPTAWPDDPAGIKQTISRALQNAEVRAHNIQAIYAAANGGKVLDAVEAEAYSEFFGDSEKQPLISSLKGALGESFSGGGIRACALALSMEENAMPPTVGLIKPIKPLGFVAGDKREIRINNAVLAGISFGGTYAYLVFANCDK